MTPWKTRVSECVSHVTDWSVVLVQFAVLQAGSAYRGHSPLLVPSELSGVQLLPGDVGRSSRHW